MSMQIVQWVDLMSWQFGHIELLLVFLIEWMPLSVFGLNLFLHSHDYRCKVLTSLVPPLLHLILQQWGTTSNCQRVAHQNYCQWTQNCLLTCSHPVWLPLLKQLSDCEPMCLTRWNLCIYWSVVFQLCHAEDKQTKTRSHSRACRQVGLSLWLVSSAWPFSWFGYCFRIPGRLNDRRTPLGELNWIFTAITDTIAWNTLPRGNDPLEAHTIK